MAREVCSFLTVAFSSRPSCTFLGAGAALKNVSLSLAFSVSMGSGEQLRADPSRDSEALVQGGFGNRLMGEALAWGCLVATADSTSPPPCLSAQRSTWQMLYPPSFSGQGYSKDCMH